MTRPQIGFRTTRWSIVCATVDTDVGAARAALDELCSAYWMPLYSVLRRDGHSEHAAMDLVQGFLARLLEKRDIGGADPDLGRFRSFLLGALRNYVRNEHRAAGARKRGGGAITFSLDVQTAEDRYRDDLIDPTTPEELYDRQFALALLERVIESLAAEYRDRGRDELFQALKRYLVERPEQGDYERLAEELCAEEGAIKVTVHRMRKRLRALLTKEIADTVADARDVDEEFDHLFAALGK